MLRLQRMTRTSVTAVEGEMRGCLTAVRHLRAAFIETALLRGRKEADMIVSVNEKAMPEAEVSPVPGATVVSPETEELMKRVRAGDVRALARAISLVENGATEASELLSLCRLRAGDSVLAGITGPTGAGKSTLVDQMARHLRAGGRSVGIIAVDPTSPFTGGALLGDRIRMQGFAGDDGVYIRSLASRGARGGLARAAGDVCLLMEAAGRDMILVETMGVGQDEIEVATIADLTVLVLVPGMGDDVQSLKAGVMEAADIYVVNKADRDGADRVEGEIRAMQDLGGNGGVRPPVFKTVALDGTGVAELLAGIDATKTSKKRNVPASVVEDRSLRLDHIGIAVRSIASARGFYDALGMTVNVPEMVEHEQVLTAMLVLGESRLELIEPLDRDSTIGRFLQKRGEGLHHIAIRARDIEGKFREMQHRGVRLVSDSIRIGAGGHRYFFIHPASTGGVLIEVVGDTAHGATPHGKLETCE